MKELFFGKFLISFPFLISRSAFRAVTEIMETLAEKDEFNQYPKELVCIRLSYSISHTQIDVQVLLFTDGCDTSLVGKKV
jgi:hypothetical protein